MANRGCYSSSPGQVTDTSSEKNFQPIYPDYRPTDDELRIINECRVESFWTRCVPLGLVFGASAKVLVQSGYLAPSSRFGSIPKVLGATVLAYFFGKGIYVLEGKCPKKIMDKIPDSNYAMFLRNMKNPEYFANRSDQASHPPSYTQRPTELDRMDLDLDRQSVDVKELDDSLRPTLDTEVKAVTEETGSPAQHPTLTYDQLRDDNRHRQGPGSPASMVQRRPAFDRPTTTTQPSAASSSDRSRSQNTLDSDVSARPRPFRPPSDPLGDISGKRNKYGDDWDE